MKAFKKQYTWDRSSLPDSVNNLLDEIVNAKHVTVKRDMKKGKMLQENAPATSFVSWAQKYHPGKRYDEIPISNTNKIPEDIYNDPMKLDQYLTSPGNEPGLVQFFQQRGLTGKTHTSKYKEYVDMDWPEEQRLQLINYARWQDEGPRRNNGDLLAYQPVPPTEQIGRSTNMRRIYGPVFAPYVNPTITNIRRPTPKPEAKTPAAQRLVAEEYDQIAKVVTPMHSKVLNELRTRRKMGRQEITNLADIHRVQSQMAQVLNTEGGVSKAYDILAAEVEGAYNRKKNNTAAERTQQEIDKTIELLEVGPDKLDMDMGQIPGALPIDPLAFIKEMEKKAKTPEGKAWVAMAARRVMPSAGIPVGNARIRMNRGYRKVPEDMAQELGFVEDVFMPASAIKQWQWQREALKAAFDDTSFVRQFTKFIKANLTAANLPTLLYNLTSNVGMQLLTRGPTFMPSMLRRNLQYQAFKNGKKFDADTQTLFEAIEDSGALSTDFHRLELEQAVEGYPALRQEAKKVKGFKQYLKSIVDDPIDALKGAATLRPLTKLYGDRTIFLN